MTDRPRVLVVVPDVALRTAVRGVLDGFLVVETTGATTAAVAAACRPDLIVLDATDRSAAARTMAALRRDFRTTLTSILYIVDAVPADDWLAGFGGGDDYVIRPFDAQELAARVRLSLLRSHARWGINPLTRLPGNTSVAEEIAGRQAAGSPFACLYIDLDRFKAFNDRHGFARGDEAILAAARTVVRVIGDTSPGECFVGHVGGDDLVVLAPTSMAERAAARICEDFAAQARGCALSIGVVDRADSFADPSAVACAAAEAKAAAKSRPGSTWAVWRGVPSPA